MGFFGKVKGKINDAINNAKVQATEKQEEEKKRREEALRFSPISKSLEWFKSEDGIKTFNEYVTVENYFLQETLKEEYDSYYSQDPGGFDGFLFDHYPHAKVPYVFFLEFARSIKVQALEWSITLSLLATVLSEQAKPFYIDDDGEPNLLDAFTPEEIVSPVKNPILYFVSNFDSLSLEDDAEGAFEDKYELWSNVILWLFVFASFDKDIISKNLWIFSKETYLNDFGHVKKLKGFYKQCIELASEEEYKKYFEEKYAECE